MGQQLAGKTAIITGGASGIGRATAEHFVGEGARVVIADLDQARGEALAARLGSAALFHRTNVSDRNDVQGLVDFAVERFGRLDIMFNNAGVPSLMASRFIDDEVKDFQQVMAVNVFGVMIGAQIAARAMRKTGGGSIVNTASSAGTMPGLALMTYRVSKAAVAHFTKSVAIEFAEYGIRVNGVAPGYIKTEMTAFAAPNLSAEDCARVEAAMQPAWLSGQPLKRQGQPQDVARTVAFLASDQAAHLTGVVLPVDGGVTIGDPVNHLEELMAASAEAMRAL